MSARKVDPIVAEARARMLAAGQALAQAERAALRELRQVERLLARHPEAKAGSGLAHWLRGLCQTFIRAEAHFDLGEIGRGISDAAQYAERRLAKFEADEADLAAGRVPADRAAGCAQ